MVTLTAILDGETYQIKQYINGRSTLVGLTGQVAEQLIDEGFGADVARQIRQLSQVPILLITPDETAVGSPARVHNAGKSRDGTFALGELLARFSAILNAQPLPEAKFGLNARPYRSGQLVIDLELLRVTSHGRLIHLTPHEWSMLRVFVKHAGNVVSSRQLLQEAWGPDYGDEGDYVRTYVRHLRRKLEPDPQHPRYILLERGLGYRLAGPD